MKWKTLHTKYRYVRTARIENKLRNALERELFTHERSELSCWKFGCMTKHPTRNKNEVSCQILPVGKCLAIFLLQKVSKFRLDRTNKALFTLCITYLVIASTNTPTKASTPSYHVNAYIFVSYSNMDHDLLENQRPITWYSNV